MATVYVKMLANRSVSLSYGSDDNHESLVLTDDGLWHAISTDLAATTGFQAMLAAGDVQLSTDSVGANVIGSLPTGATRPISASYRPLRSPTSILTVNTVTETLQAGTVAHQWDQSAGQYRYTNCVPEELTGNPFLCLNNNNTVAQTIAAPYLPIGIEFWTNATDLRVLGFQSGQPDMWALVDDRPVLDGTYLHANFADDLFTWKMAQAAAVPRKIRLEFTSTFYQITTNAGAGIWPTTSRGRMLVVGDSYTQGGLVIANAVVSGTAGVISAGMPWGVFEQLTGYDVWRQAIYGTGYVADSDFAGVGHYGSAQRVAKIAGMPPMDFVVVMGSVNDDPSDVATVLVAAQQAWTDIKAAQPTAPLIVVGLECYGFPDATADALNEALGAAAHAHPDVHAFVDLRSRSFMTGLGKDGAPSGSGNSDLFLANDGAHLTHQGAWHWGENLMPLIGSIPIPSNEWGGSY